MNLEPVLYWMNAREELRVRKERDEPPEHWTDDPILSKFRFCNVRREDDRVTVWVRERIREPFADHPALWFMLCVARIYNLPATLDELMKATDAWPNRRNFSPKAMGAAIDDRIKRGQQVFNGAYMIRGQNDPRYQMWSKGRYVAEVVLGNLWKNRARFKPFPTTLEATHALISEHPGWGPFLAYQSTVDMQFTALLCNASDRHAWAAAGPGTIRGLNRVYGRLVDVGITQYHALEEIRLVDAALRARTDIPFDALSDTCNLLCETDKLQRAKLGEGKPKALYRPFDWRVE